MRKTTCLAQVMHRYEGGGHRDLGVSILQSVTFRITVRDHTPHTRFHDQTNSSTGHGWPRCTQRLGEPTRREDRGFNGHWYGDADIADDMGLHVQ